MGQKRLTDYQRGIEAARLGGTVFDCPYGCVRPDPRQSIRRQNWLAGYRAWWAGPTGEAA